MARRLRSRDSAMAKFKGSDKPRISELHDHVREQVAPKWSDLGVQLLDDKQAKKLDVIQSNHRGDSEQCCTEMFKYWLEVDENASWDKLITALKHISHVTLAKEIKAMTYKGGVGKQKLERKRKISSDPESDLDSMSGDEESPASTSEPKKKRKATTFGSVLAQKPKMRELTKIVIPRVKAHWKDLAYAMEYCIGEVDGFDRDGRDLHDRCEKLFGNWLETGHGPMPKTYQTLLKYIKDVDYLNAASEEIEAELTK